MAKNWVNLFWEASFSSSLSSDIDFRLIPNTLGVVFVEGALLVFIVVVVAVVGLGFGFIEGEAEGVFDRVDVFVLEVPIVLLFSLIAFEIGDTRLIALVVLL